MRICFFADPTSIHLEKWVRHFVSRGDEVHLISVQGGELGEIEIYPVDLIGLAGKRWTFQLWRTLVEMVRIRTTLLRIRPDIVHIHFLYSHPSMLSFLGIKNLVISCWGSDIIPICPRERPFRRWVKKALLRRARAITAVSHFLAGEIANDLPPTKQVKVIPFGVDLGLFNPQKRLRQGKGIAIGFAKALEPKYGPEHLVRAFSQVVKKHPETTLLIAGEGPMEKELRELVGDLGLSEKVAFQGWVPHQRMRDYLTGLDLFCMPSVHSSESLGVAALEAQACEVPVVATRIGGVPETVVDGQTGFLVEPDDERALADAILRLIEHPQLREAMGKRGGQFVREHYDWQDSTLKMEKIYEDVLAPQSDTVNRNSADAP